MKSSSEESNFVVREIEQRDLENGFFQTISNLSEIGKISDDFERARKILHEICSNPFYKIFIAAKNTGEVIGSITILIEQKFIHDGGKVGHIEDVVTKKNYEGLGVGSALVKAAIKFAIEKSCYKVILDCSAEKMRFYKKHGFNEHDISMRYDIIL